MGTSSTTAGPKSPAWSTAKGAATRLAKGSPGASPRHVVRQAARALVAGASGGAAWSPGSVRTAQRLGGLLAGATREGLVESARRFGIGDLNGKSAGEALMDLLDWVAADAVDLDDQAARRAAEAVLAGLVRDEVDLDRLLEPQAAANLFRAFLVQYLTRTIIGPLAKRITENASASKAREIELNLTRLVDALVQLEVPAAQLATIDWLGPQGAAVVERIRDQALEVLAEDPS